MPRRSGHDALESAFAACGQTLVVSERRLEMRYRVRILSVGHPLAHREIDNYSVFSAPAFSDYEVVVVDPAGVFAAVREVIDATAPHETFSGVPIVNGQSTTDRLGIADVLRRRRDETAAVLERGGLVVVFGSPPAVLPEVVGYGGADRYGFLPAPAGLAWSTPLLHWGEGSAVAITDHAHPFAGYIDALHDELLYRAVFDDRAPGFAGAAQVFARTGGGAPVGVQFAAFGGHIVFLPAPKLNGATALAEGTSIEAGARELLGRPDPTDVPPYWLGELPVPGLAPLETEATNARELATRAEERAVAAALEAATLARMRDVLWHEGRHALLPAVLRCCELLGFQNWDGEPTLRSPEGTLFLEAEGGTAEVGMAPHYRLRARIDGAIAQDAEVTRGLVVVNGQRNQRPDARTAPYVEALRVAASASGYALLTTPDLFAAALLGLAGADPSTLAAIRKRLFETDGVVELGDLVGAAAD